MKCNTFLVVVVVDVVVVVVVVEYPPPVLVEVRLLELPHELQHPLYIRPLRPDPILGLTRIDSQVQVRNRFL